MAKFTISDECIGCGICAKNCPVGAVSGENKEKHVIDQDKCIGCTVCGRLCPKSAVKDENGKAFAMQKKSEWKKPVVDVTACAGCRVCVENCPENCLKLSEPRKMSDTGTYAVLADPDKCLGCGICEKVCPVGAVKLKDKNDKTVTYERKKKMFYDGYCRVFQAVMKLGNYFMGYRTPEYIEGPGSIKQLPAQIKAKGVNNVLLVTDNGLMSLGIPNGLIQAMDEAGLKYTIFSEIQPNPTDLNVEAGLKLFLENKCEGIIAFGGGSPMDCAKGIAARKAHPNKTVAQLQGLLKVHKKIVPFWAVPTTAGTGSETTVAAVITEAATHHKASINDPAILPKYAVLDPELTMGLPPYTTATTGMDALCHAVEAYTNNTYNTKEEVWRAKEAVKLIYDWLYVAYQDGKNLEARQNMQLAAFHAGRAFTRGCVGYVHAVGHTLGGLYGVAHGVAMSVILPHVMRQFGPAVYDKLADLADVCGMQGNTNAEKAEAFISWMEDLKVKMGIPAGFDCIRKEDYDQIYQWANAEANPLYPVPVIWHKEDFFRLLDTLSAAK